MCVCVSVCLDSVLFDYVFSTDIAFNIPRIYSLFEILSLRKSEIMLS